MLVRKSPEGLLIISDKPEFELVPKMERWALLKIIGGPLLTLACSAYLLFIFS